MAARFAIVLALVLLPGCARASTDVCATPPTVNVSGFQPWPYAAACASHDDPETGETSACREGTGVFEEGRTCFDHRDDITGASAACSDVVVGSTDACASSAGRSAAAYAAVGIGSASAGASAIGADPLAEASIAAGGLWPGVVVDASVADQHAHEEVVAPSPFSLIPVQAVCVGTPRGPACVTT